MSSVVRSYSNKRKRSKTRSYGYSKLNAKVEKLARIMPKVEVKECLVNLSSAYVTRTWVLSLLNGMVHGTVEGTRLGDAIRCKSLILNILVENQQQQPVNSTTIRMLVFKWPRVSGTAPTSSVFAGSALALCDVMDKNYGIKVYRDVNFLLEAATGTNGPYHSSRLTKFKIPLDFTTQYNAGNAGTVGDIESNALYFAIVAGPTDGSADNRWCTCQGTASLEYSDA